MRVDATATGQDRNVGTIGTDFRAAYAKADAIPITLLVYMPLVYLVFIPELIYIYIQIQSRGFPYPHYSRLEF